MAVFENFPYTNVHELNLDWVIKQVKENNIKIEDLTNLFYNEISEKITEYVNENLSQFLLGAMYNEANTSIKLQPVEVIGDSDHIYNNEQIIVMEGR